MKSVSVSASVQGICVVIKVSVLPNYEERYFSLLLTTITDCTVAVSSEEASHRPLFLERELTV